MAVAEIIERIDTVIVGAGQAGLSAGRELTRCRVPFVILDAGRRIGEQWRGRWDSLRLFTPARFSGLNGMRFPAPPDSFPTKDQMADFLEAYARRFELPVRLGVRVERVARVGDRFLVVAPGLRIEANHVIIAMANHQQPKIPACAGELDPGIVQLHSSAYRHQGQLREGDVLIVGAGNSGAEIGIETARGHRTWMAGRSTGQIPFRIDGFAGRRLLVWLVLRGLFHRVLTLRTPIGRLVRPKILHGGGPLIRTRSSDLARAGIERVPRLVGVRDGRPLLEDGRVLDVANVIWCTGFHPGFSWIDRPIFDSYGEPNHHGGVVPGEPGLYFVGLHFLYSLSSEMIHGVGRDARRVARLVAADHRAAARVDDPALRPRVGLPQTARSRF